MSEKATETMTDAGFIDAIGDKFREVLKPVLAPVLNPPPASALPAWLTYLLGVALTVALSFVAARWGVTPTPVPSLPLAQPQVIVLQVPYGGTVEAAKAGK